MSDGFTFELHHYSTKKEFRIEGAVGPYGKVVTTRPKVKLWGKELPYIEVRLQGENFPDTLYRSNSSSRVSLVDSTLSVGGVRVEFDFNRRAFRSKSRALRISYRERSYAYTVVRVERSFALERPGATITLDRTKSAGGKGATYTGHVTGAVDAVDLALAIILQHVDTLDLTSVGAATTALNKLYNLPSKGNSTAE